jgi:hypothetical protein
LGLEDAIPDHSVFSRARHERFREAEAFRLVFERAVRLDSGDGDVCLELAQPYMDTGSPAGKKIRRLLRMTSRSRNVTPYGREEAGRLLRCL